VTNALGVLRRAFISYRSDDTRAAASRLASELRRKLECEVFHDSRISGGDVWPERLRNEVRRADVVLVLIGSRWLTLQGRDGIRLLDDPNDWVRQEIEQALEADRTIIPVLIDEAAPIEKHALRTVRSIESLADRQAVHLDTRRWDTDFQSVVATLGGYGFHERTAVDGSASPMAGASEAEEHHHIEELRNARSSVSIRALLAGSVTAAVVAVVTSIVGLGVPQLEAWNVNSTAVVRLLVAAVAGSATFYVLRGRRRALSLGVAFVAAAGCGYAWYTVGVKAAAPASVVDWLTWNGTLYVLYLTGFALCAAALNALVRSVAPNA
jgi:hypothetical protein